MATRYLITAYLHGELRAEMCDTRAGAYRMALDWIDAPQAADLSLMEWQIVQAFNDACDDPIDIYEVDTTRADETDLMWIG